jgi:hypothetical protein
MGWLLPPFQKKKSSNKTYIYGVLNSLSELVIYIYMNAVAYVVFFSEMGKLYGVLRL